MIAILFIPLCFKVISDQINPDIQLPYVNNRRLNMFDLASPEKAWKRKLKSCLITFNGHPDITGIQFWIWWLIY